MLVIWDSIKAVSQYCLCISSDREVQHLFVFPVDVWGMCGLGTHVHAVYTCLFCLSLGCLGDTTCVLHAYVCSVDLWGVSGTPTCVLHAHVCSVDLWGVSETPTCVLHAHTEAGDRIGSSSLVLDLAFEAVAL